MSTAPINVLLGIFSGIGNKLFDKKDKIPKVTIENHNHIQFPETDKNNILDEISEVAGIVRRLNEFLGLLNENRRYDIFTIAKLAKIMDCKSVGELENYFKGKVEPDFEFLERFSNVFGVNYSWLLEGKGQPFYSNKQTEYDPFGYYSYIKELKPERIYFLRSDAKEGYTFILLKLTDWKYEILHRKWHISSHVGAGGSRQIYGMYKLIKKLKKDNYSKCYGRILKDGDFNLLYFGEKFPSSIIDFKYQDSLWWDDFTDVNHTYSISDSYERNYGDEFVAAQKIAKSFLGQEKND